VARRAIDKDTPALQRATIVRAALAVLDTEGFNNLTLRRVATELGVQAPAIYWHVKDKTTLIDYMAEAILQTQFSELKPRRDEEPWEEWFVDTMKKLRAAMWTYRDGGRIVTGAHLFPAITLIKLFETSYMSLTSAGIDIKTAHIIVGTAIHFVFGRVIEEQSGPSPEQFKHVNIHELFADYPLFLRSLDANPN
jgi:TetR/AcrR family tetracycline transcriptional repressor